MNDQLFIKMVLSAWETQTNRVDKLLTELSDAQLLMPTAQGRNSGLYLLGHLAAVTDGMFPLLGWGERLYPALENIFVKNPDQSNLTKPSLTEVRDFWKKINAKLNERIQQTPLAEWLQRHMSVTPEDFAKEPHRNKLNIMVSRANHHAYHLGQLVYLKPKS